MTVTASQTGRLYLRGASYAEYTGLAWQRGDQRDYYDHWPSFRSDTQLHTLTVTTRQAHSVLYLPYYTPKLSQLVGGRAQSSGIKVYAIECKEEACSLIGQNAEKFGLSNIQIIHGKAPEALERLEPPTHAFIGGSSGELREILKVLKKAAGSVRIVINAVSLETIAEIQSTLKVFKVSDLSVEQISVSRSRELGNYHLMTAENPVLIASFTMGGES
jgi:precorrin-6B methylase 2